MDSLIKKIFVVPDIHGDFLALYTCLKFLCGALDTNNTFQLDHACIVFMGDMIDRQRGDTPSEGEFPGEEETILDIINLLIEISKYSKCRIVKVIGNHETMRILENDDRYASEMSARIDFSPGSRMAKKVAYGSNVLCAVNGVLFCHGGLSSRNNPVGMYDTSNKVIRRLLTTRKRQHLDMDRMYYKKYIVPFLWDRYLGDRSKRKIDCDLVNEILENIGEGMKLNRIVVAHSPQMGCEGTVNEKFTLETVVKRGQGVKTFGGRWVCHQKGKAPICGMNGQCKDSNGFPRVIRTDIAMSRAFENPLDHPNDSRLPQVMVMECENGMNTGKMEHMIVSRDKLKKLYSLGAESVKRIASDIKHSLKRQLLKLKSRYQKLS